MTDIFIFTFCIYFMRHIAAGYIIVILMFVLPAALGSSVYSMENTASQQLSGTVVTDANTWSVWSPNYKNIPSSTTGTSGTFFFPSNDSSAIIFTALTVGIAQNSTVTQISLLPSVNINENLKILVALGSSYRNYTVLYQISTSLNLKNGTTTSSVPLNIPVQPYYYSFPSNYHFIIIISGASYGSEFSSNVILKGSTNTAVNILLSPIAWIEVTLAILGILAFILAIISMPWIELHTDMIARRMKHIARRGGGK